ncbi:MAG: hypothetical protein V2A79_05585 [Planctomycetota bacterium]
MRRPEQEGQAPEHALFLRLGWGIGWTSMTANLTTPEEKKALLENNNFGNRLSRLGPQAYSPRQPFPKSRKLLLRGEEPAGTAGWLRLDPADHLPRLIPRGPAVPESPPAFKPGAGRAAKAQAPEVPLFPLVVEIAALRPHEVAGRIKAYFDRMKGIEDEEEKRAVGQAVLEKINQAGLWKKWKDKDWCRELAGMMERSGRQ